MSNDITIKILNRIPKYSIAFFDFDGVIKDSVHCKGLAFSSLFSKYGDALMKRIEAHHKNNPGVPRSEKIAVYLTWAGEFNNPTTVKDYCTKFATISTRATINAPWIPGVKNYLESNHKKQKIILVSAIPKQELIYIISQLNIKSYFCQTFGFPTTKENAIRQALKKHDCDNTNAVFIGDTLTDWQAADSCSVDFVYRGRKTIHTNSELSTCDSINDFIII